MQERCSSAQKEMETLGAKLKELEAGESAAKMFPALVQFLKKDDLEKCRDEMTEALRQAEQMAVMTEVGLLWEETSTYLVFG